MKPVTSPPKMEPHAPIRPTVVGDVVIVADVGDAMGAGDRLNPNHLRPNPRTAHPNIQLAVEDKVATIRSTSTAISASAQDKSVSHDDDPASILDAVGYRVDQLKPNPSNAENSKPQASHRVDPAQNSSVHALAN